MCTHCGCMIETGWTQDELLQMIADGAYPPSVCAGCWHSVAAAWVDVKCDDPANCSHRVRED